VTVSEYKMLDHAPIGTCVINIHCEVVYWNKCLEDWSGILRSEIVGSELKTHFPHFNELKYSDRIEQVFKGGPPLVFSSQFHPHIIPAPLRNGKLRIQHTILSSTCPESSLYDTFNH